MPAIELLDRQCILDELTAASRQHVSHLEILPSTDSTNNYLLSQVEHDLASGTVCLAEQQTAGRGRRGRQWLSPFAANLYLSILWRFDLPLQQLSTLSIVSGIAVVRALRRIGAQLIGLKWPNDIYYKHHKLAGLLADCGTCPNTKSSFVVLGVGINVAMPNEVQPDQPWTDLNTVLAPNIVLRNQLAAIVLDELITALQQFSDAGFAAFGGDWRQFDLSFNQPVAIHLNGHIINGIARGIDDRGALRVETPKGLRHFVAGDVSLRINMNEHLDEAIG